MMRRTRMMMVKKLICWRMSRKTKPGSAGIAGETT
jgi:hypothetical protein